MKKRAIRKCKGLNKAEGYGCGEVKEIHKYGLCFDCFKKWLKTANGKRLVESYTNRAKKKIEKEKRVDLKEQKEAIKTKSEYEKALQTLINSIVRLLDLEKKCISCKHPVNGIWTRQKHASHYFTVGAHNEIRYNLHQIHTACSICNNWKSGNIKGYRKGIIKRYGQEYMDLIESLPLKYKDVRLTIPELKECLKRAKTIKKEILNGKDYTREEINNLIKIYN